MSDSFASVDAEPRALSTGPWIRWAIFAALGVVVVLALTNRFGQRPTERLRAGPVASLRLSAPHAVRGGLFFQSLLEVRARQAIDEPRIVLDRGWLEGMQVNSIEPQPTDEASRDGRVVLSYDSLSPGDLLRVWLQFEVNPTHVGRHSYGVELDDAQRPVARISHSLTSWP
jgi:hypothetical protein